MHAFFDQSIPFDPAGDFASFLKSVPAKWVVYLLADAEDRPVQLLCVKNLRYSLERRLGEQSQEQEPSRRVNYRDLVRKVYWRRVDSRFEADWIYLQAAREVFPQSYRTMTGFWQAWFIHVDPSDEYPRFVKSDECIKSNGTYLGPLENKSDASRLIECVEDWFDLCRYHHILTDAPLGKACAYKDMGKCPAPCDGSISLSAYRALIDWSLQTLMDPAEMLDDLHQRMQAAAMELQFESAGRIKHLIDQLSELGKGPWRHLRPMNEFRFVSFQPGPKQGQVKVFAIVGGSIAEILGLIALPDNQIDLIELVERIEHHHIALDLADSQTIGMVTYHLFAPKPAGVFIRFDGIDRRELVAAYRHCLKQKPADENAGEGLIKELGATQ